MDLIDRNKLKLHHVWADRHTATGNVCKLVVEVADIEKLPTIDAVPVIRCKDCKYWAEAGREYNPNTNSWSAVMVCDYDECPEGCGHTCWSTDADDFCSRGVRK